MILYHDFMYTMFTNICFSGYNMMDIPGSLTSNMDERRKSSFTGFGGRKESDSEEDEPKPMARIPGAAIAPPPSLQESFVSSPGQQQSSGIGMGMGVAAKIMAKYGFKVIIYYKFSINSHLICNLQISHIYLYKKKKKISDFVFKMS